MGRITSWSARGASGNAGQLLGHRAAGDRHAIAVQQTGLQQHLQHLRHAAGPVEVDRDILARRLQVAQHRHLLADALEVVDRPFDFSRRGDRQEVQHRVGRAAGGHDQRDSVLDGVVRDDVARAQVVLDGFDEHARRFRRGIGLLRVRRGHLRRTQQADAQGLERRRHRVGGIHAPARADARAGVLLDAVVVLLRHRARGERAHRLERRHDGQRLALPLPGLDGAGVDVDRRHVHPCHRHNATRHVLVAAADNQHAVHALAVDRRLDRVGDHFARDQRILHAFGAHADAVGHGRHAEHLRHRAGFLQRRHRPVDQRLDAGVARIHRAVAVGHADDRLLEIAVAEPHGAQHRAIRGAGDALRDQFGAAVERHAGILGLKRCSRCFV